MHRLILATLVCLGCSAGPVRRGDSRVERFEAFVDSQQIKARFARVVSATQQVLRADGFTPRAPKRFAGRTIVAGTRGDPRIPNARRSGCSVEIFNQATGVQLRAICFQQPPPRRVGELPQRVEWQDSYLVARILARIDPTLGRKIWSVEPTGQRTHACAHARPPRPRGCTPGR